MFADHVSMNVMWINAAVAAEQTAEAGRVEGGAGSEDPARGDPAPGCKSRSNMRHHVNRIRGHDEHGIRSLRESCRHDFVEHRRIALKELKPRFAGSLPDAGTQ